MKFEQQKRDALSSKFETTIADIKLKMDSDLSSKRTLALEATAMQMARQKEIDDTETLKATHAKDIQAIKLKLAQFIEQYEMRELHFLHVMETKDISVQYTAAKLCTDGLMFESDLKESNASRKEQNLNSQEEAKAEKIFTDALIKELDNNQIDTELKQTQSTNKELLSRISQHEKAEVELKNQLALYVDKFNQVENTLQKSNTLFSTFKQEMQKMTDKTLSLEKENNEMKKRFDTITQTMTALMDDVILLLLL